MARSREPSTPTQTSSTGRPPRYLIVLLVLAVIWAAFWGVLRLQSAAPAPVVLSEGEQVQLEAKLRRVADPQAAPRPDGSPVAPIIDLEAEAEPLIPELYEETDAARTVQFTERELNALIARDPDLAGRVALRLTPGQVSAQLRMDIPEDIPLLGGHTLNVRSGLRFDIDDDQLNARLVGVSIAGIPLPNAWLGGLKDEDLLALEPFRQLRAGIETIEVGDGELALHLAR